MFLYGLHATRRVTYYSTVIVTVNNMLRAYQQDLKIRCYHAWAGGMRNLIPVLPTGGGKTALMADIATDHNEPGVAIAHRSVLIGQLSMALAKAGLQHDIIAQKAVVRTIVSKQMDEIGRSFYNPSAQFKVASVDTLPGRAPALGSWIQRVTLGFTDESHHVLRENKWGKECLRFTNPRMRWLLPTATPERGDGKGLGRDAAGIADEIIEGPSMRWHIENGYLTGYQIRGVPPPSDFNLDDVTIGSNGEYNQVQVRRAVHRSGSIVGNVVDTYKRLTPGKLGIVFAVDIEHAKALTAEFVKKGVTCELITADHSEEERRDILKRYKLKQTLVLVNVDLFGEGFDLPAIEVVMMVRPTASYSLYAQQFGRGIRLGVDDLYLKHWESYTVEQRLVIIAASVKPVAFIHDHVGNVLHFNGPPDKPRERTLEGRTGRGGPSDAIPLRTCLNPVCLHPYERYLVTCPLCGTPAPEPHSPSLPTQVEGDITLYTPEMLKALFGVDTVEQALAKQTNTFCMIPPNMASMNAVRAIQAAHARKLLAQQKLGIVMPLLMPPVLTPREAMRKFFLQTGIDVVQARLLGGADTEALLDKIQGVLTKH